MSKDETKSDLPTIPKELLEALEKRFPDRAPDPSKTEKEIWIDVGAVKVIRLLRDRFDRQQQNVLGN